MKWMEFIKVQTASRDVADKLLNLLDEFNQSQRLLEARVFNNVSVDDCSLFLLWNTEKPETQGSTLGLSLGNAMKQFGLVDHTVWIEKGNSEGKKS